MNTVYQSRVASPDPADRRGNERTEPDLTLTPLQALMEEAGAGGDQHNGAGPQAPDELRNPANFATPGPMTSLLSEPLLANPFESTQITRAQRLAADALRQSQPTTYTVKSGDTLNGIAATKNMSLNELISLNPWRPIRR